MFSHIMIGSDDINRSKTFYDALFAVIGGKPGEQDQKGRLIYSHDGGRFLMTKPIDGQRATPGNGSTIGFAMDGPEQAQGMAQGWRRTWRYHYRRPTGRARDSIRQGVSRLSARSGRQQALRVAQDGQLTC